ncbi:SpoIIE family protein phosphatase [Streptomyces sp. WMMC500]|uniref:SpoIIE family protein phosphatase n=1 Tax=Streptomyces sp. WMMC500 TaxID=3015154 RepID=UPI00248C7F9E|nr:SpoIIE family protein phosphatase [Streptomyces sp. WMMC500]WBB59560.1 SpoIIE family protein phosphatase [Streptomyces sp. WMMC500]
MSDRGGPAAPAREAGDWPAPAALSMELNHMGSFDWDLARGQMHLDEGALRVMDLRPEEFDGAPGTLGSRLTKEERARLEALISQAIAHGRPAYSAYLRVQLRDGTTRLTHAQGTILRDDGGRAHRVVGMVRDATLELNFSAQQFALDQERRRQTGVIQQTAAALANASTVQDVIGVLGGPEGLARLGAVNMILGLAEAGRIRIVTVGEGRESQLAEYVRVDDPGLPMSEVVRTGRPRLVLSRAEFAAAYPRLYPHAESLGIDSAAYLPLIAEGRVIGALGLSYRGKSAFSPEERNLLIALSSGIGQSLQRAKLHDREHDLAGELQQAMLPRSIPEVPGAEVAVRYRPAHEGQGIGGDWYDVIALPGGRVGVVIGDVQGHDTKAAAVMGQLRIVLRAYAGEGHAPATVMARASEFLHELDTERFATCTYAEIDLSSGALQLVRAGHIDPLVRHTDGGCRWLTVPGGLPLGLSATFGPLDYPVTTLTLDPGDALLMCTDGLVEVPGADLDDGLAQLAELVRTGPRDIGELSDRLCDVVDERHIQDDMALVILRRTAGDTAQPGGRLRQYIPASDPDALSAARHMIRSAVRSWGAGERADEIELVSDELITNALLHTDGPAVVTIRPLSTPEPRLRVEVEDRSSALPHRREPGEAGVSGRGLLLVDMLADVWGVESRGNDKCVWAEFG